MARPTLQVRKLSPRGAEGAHPRSRRTHTVFPEPRGASRPSPHPLTSLSGLWLPCGGAWSSPGHSHLGALPSLPQLLGVARKECPLRTDPAPPCPWPLLGSWPGGCREAQPRQDPQENAELSLVRREEGLVCEAACSGDRTQHTPCQPERRGSPGGGAGQERKRSRSLGAQSPPPSPHSPAAASPAPRLARPLLRATPVSGQPVPDPPGLPPWPPGAAGPTGTRGGGTPAVPPAGLGPP